jgi:hypothetical protein
VRLITITYYLPSAVNIINLLSAAVFYPHNIWLLSVYNNLLSAAVFYPHNIHSIGFNFGGWLGDYKIQSTDFYRIATCNERRINRVHLKSSLYTNCQIVRAERNLILQPLTIATKYYVDRKLQRIVSCYIKFMFPSIRIKSKYQ